MTARKRGVNAKRAKSLTPEGRVSYMKTKGANREIGVPRGRKGVDG